MLIRWAGCCTWSAATSHVSHHLLGHLHHFRIIHHFFNHWIIHHFLHIRHVWHATWRHLRHLLTLRLLRRSLWHLLTLHSHSLLLGLLDEFWVISCHLWALLNIFWSHVRYHCVKLLVSEFHTVHCLVLLAHHRWVALHHIAIVIELILGHVIHHVKILLNVLIRGSSRHLWHLLGHMLRLKLLGLWFWGFRFRFCIDFFDSWLIFIGGGETRLKFLLWFFFFWFFFLLIHNKLTLTFFVQFFVCLLYLLKNFVKFLFLRHCLFCFGHHVERALYLIFGVVTWILPDRGRHSELAFSVWRFLLKNFFTLLYHCVEILRLQFAMSYIGTTGNFKSFTFFRVLEVIIQTD